MIKRSGLVLGIATMLLTGCEEVGNDWVEVKNAEVIKVDSYEKCSVKGCWRDEYITFKAGDYEFSLLGGTDIEVNLFEEGQIFDVYIENGNILRKYEIPSLN